MRMGMGRPSENVKTREPDALGRRPRHGRETALAVGDAVAHAFRPVVALALAIAWATPVEAGLNPRGVARLEEALRALLAVLAAMKAGEPPPSLDDARLDQVWATLDHVEDLYGPSFSSARDGRAMRVVVGLHAEAQEAYAATLARAFEGLDRAGRADRAEVVALLAGCGIAHAGALIALTADILADPPLEVRAAGLDAVPDLARAAARAQIVGLAAILADATTPDRAKTRLLAEARRVAPAFAAVLASRERGVAREALARAVAGCEREVRGDAQGLAAAILRTRSATSVSMSTP